MVHIKPYTIYNPAPGTKKFIRFISCNDHSQGDSGGPLTVEVGGQHSLAGVVSFGPRPCEQVGYLYKNHRITVFRIPALVFLEILPFYRIG